MDGDGAADLTGAFTQGSGASRYRAPELQEGAAHSAQSDIYSAGVIFYEMLSGRSPSPDRPSPLADLRPDVPRDLTDAVMGCLEKGPDWRPKDLSYLLQVVRTLRSQGAGKGVREPRPRHRGAPLEHAQGSGRAPTGRQVGFHEQRAPLRGRGPAPRGRRRGRVVLAQGLARRAQDGGRAAHSPASYDHPRPRGRSRGHSDSPAGKPTPTPPPVDAAVPTPAPTPTPKPVATPTPPPTTLAARAVRAGGHSGAHADTRSRRPPSPRGDRPPPPSPPS